MHHMQLSRAQSTLPTSLKRSTLQN